LRRTDSTPNYNRTLKNTTEIVADDKVFIGMLSYQGQFANRDALHTPLLKKLSYNRGELDDLLHSHRM
jgi:hypothetical protein